jgi:release factor glutamine methyltransferase
VAAVANTVGDALSAAVDALRAAEVESPRLDAELLLEHASGRDRAWLTAHPEAELDSVAGRAFAELVRRRLRREPVAYILGRKAFRRLELCVDRRVLIPRPETEHLVEAVLELEPLAICDVGTGSGAIALALADELPNARVVATDIYPGALEVARANARRLGLEERVRFEQGSLPRTGSFDVVVANLPYVSDREWLGLAPEVRGYEPRGAITPGPTGLEAIEALLGELAVGAGARAAAVALEVGEGQAEVVSELVRRAGYERVERRRDLAGIERVVVGR